MDYKLKLGYTDEYCGFCGNKLTAFTFVDHDIEYNCTCKDYYSMVSIDSHIENLKQQITSLGYTYPKLKYKIKEHICHR